MSKDFTQNGLGKFKNCGSKIVPIPSFKDASVSFNLQDGLFKEYIEQLYDNLGICEGHDLPDIEDLRQLLYDLLYLRIAYVRRKRLPFSIIGTKLVIPAFYSQILFSIGRIESDDFGLILMPELPEPVWDVGAFKQLQVKVEEEELEDMDLPEVEGESAVTHPGVKEPRSLQDISREAMRLSRMFRPFFEKAGIEFATELPKSLEGNISFMTLHMISACVMSESNHNEPIYALMAAVLHNEISKKILLGRVNYGGLEYLKTLIYQVGDYERKNL